MVCNNFSKFHKFVLLALIFFKGVVATAQSEKVMNLLPLRKESWVSLSYSKIPANRVYFADGEMRVKVNKSAGPLVYKFSKIESISEFYVRGKVVGSKAKEKTPFDEDSVFRFGLVGVGDKKLKGPLKFFAPNWVKELFSLAPKGIGLDKIYFFNITNRNELVGKSRTHPNSDLIHERTIAILNERGEIDLKYKLGSPIETAAVWISIDGDETQSEYETILTEIKFDSIDK